MFCNRFGIRGGLDQDSVFISLKVSLKINEPKAKVVIPKHIASGRFSWWISTTNYDITLREV